MFDIANVSQNPVTLSDGTKLAPVGAVKGSSAKLKEIGDREKKLSGRGFITINEVKEEIQPAKTDGGKKLEEKTK